MAIWQLNIELVPEADLRERFGEIPARLDLSRDGLADSDDDPDDAELWWMGQDMSIEDMLPELRHFGPLIEWSRQCTGLRKFGNDDTNDLTVCFNEEGYIEEVGVRLDLRQLDDQATQFVVDFAVRYRCLLMDRQGHLYPANRESILLMAARSNAGKFVADPTQFLNDLGRGRIQTE